MKHLTSGQIDQWINLKRVPQHSGRILEGGAPKRKAEEEEEEEEEDKTPKISKKKVFPAPKLTDFITPFQV